MEMKISKYIIHISRKDFNILWFLILLFTRPLEWTVPHRPENVCYLKVIVNKQDQERVLGLHIAGPNAGEVLQGFAVAMKCGLTKHQLNQSIGIHPTLAEEFVGLHVTKRSGEDAKKTAC
jgi:thioredoxin reductase (NADPH)